jgi:hypothetical protein
MKAEDFTAMQDFIAVHSSKPAKRTFTAIFTVQFIGKRRFPCCELEA